MYVVFHRACRKQHAIQAMDDSADIRMKFVSHVIMQAFFPVFCGENDMYIKLRKRLWHGYDTYPFQILWQSPTPPLQGGKIFWIIFPRVIFMKKITLGYRPLPRCARENDSFHSRYRKATSALCPPSEAAILKIGPAAAGA